MKNRILIILLLFPIMAFTQSGGEAIFNTTCIACHTIGNGVLVGPDLKDVGKRQSMNWLKTFIKSPQTVFKNGDKNAATLFKNANGVIMPDQNLSDKQIEQVLAFVNGSDSTNQVSVLKTATVENEKPTTKRTTKTNAENQDARNAKNFSSIFSNAWFWVALSLSIVLFATIFALTNVIATLTKLKSKHEEE